MPINLLSFEAIKQDKKVLLQWRTDNEVNTSKFMVERSGNGNSYAAIGEVTAVNRSGVNIYNLVDEQPLGGLNFYRLKMLNSDGTFRYSPVRKINFADATDDITVYTNPVTNNKIFIASSGNCNSAVIYDAAGKMVKNYLLQGRNTTLDIKGIAQGVYQLMYYTDN